MKNKEEAEKNNEKKGFRGSATEGVHKAPHTPSIENSILKGVQLSVFRDRIESDGSVSTRIDGRDNNEERVITVQLGNEGILLRKAYTVENNTFYFSSIVVYSSAEIKKPSQEKPKQGQLSIHCNERHFQSEIDAIFNRSKIVPLEKLSIIPKVAILNIRIDVLVVFDKGGVLDLITEGIYQALYNLSIAHKLLYKNQTKEIAHTIKDLITFYPITVSLAKVKENILYDPTDEELQESTARMAITHTKNTPKEIIYWNYSGCMKYNELKQIIQKVLSVR